MSLQFITQYLFKFKSVSFLFVFFLFNHISSGGKGGLVHVQCKGNIISFLRSEQPKNNIPTPSSCPWCWNISASKL